MFVPLVYKPRLIQLVSSVFFCLDGSEPSTKKQKGLDRRAKEMGFRQDRLWLIPRRTPKRDHPGTPLLTNMK